QSRGQRCANDTNAKRIALHRYRGTEFDGTDDADCPVHDAKHGSVTPLHLQTKAAMKKKVIIPVLLTAVLVAGGLYFAHSQALEKASATTSAAPPPVPIVAGTVAQHDVPIYLTGVGTVIAYTTDIVRAQIQGQIISINFTEGQTVHAGDLLAQIDPRPYQALIEQYAGNLERDQAQLKNALANLTRYTTLGDKGWATPQLVETQQAQVGELQAMIKSDQALI